MIAPKIADITETIIKVKAHPSSPAASVTKMREKQINKSMIEIKWIFTSDSQVWIDREEKEKKLSGLYFIKRSWLILFNF